jgi:hypothetical protein
VSGKGKEGLAGGVIAGIVVGVLAGVGGLAAVVLIVLRRRKANARPYIGELPGQPHPLVEYRCEKDAQDQVVELQQPPSELATGKDGAHMLGADTVVSELPGTPVRRD